MQNNALSRLSNHLYDLNMNSKFLFGFCQFAQWIWALAALAGTAVSVYDSYEMGKHFGIIALGVLVCGLCWLRFNLTFNFIKKFYIFPTFEREIRTNVLSLLDKTEIHQNFRKLCTFYIQGLAKEQGFVFSYMEMKHNIFVSLITFACFFSLFIWEEWNQFDTFKSALVFGVLLLLPAFYLEKKIIRLMEKDFFSLAVHNWIQEKEAKNG